MDKESKYWQQEWKIEYKNRKLKIAVISAILLLLVAAAAYYISIRATRTTFSSKEEMRSYVQGKWTTEAYPEEYVFEGDNVTHTIYDTENPENDHINEDVVVRWDYIRGEIKFDYMEPLIISKTGLIEVKSHPDWMNFMKVE